MSTALEQKIAKLKELGIDTPQGILSLITSVGERGLDTPAERDYIEGVMDTGKTLNPLFTDNPNYYEGTGMKDLRYFPKYLESDNEYQMDVSKALADADITKLGIGDRGLNTPAEREFIMKQQAFEAELTKLSSADLSSVLELFQGLSPQEKDTYMNYVLENGFNYGTINETPLRQQGFQQYNTGTGNLQNLGFGY